MRLPVAVRLTLVPWSYCKVAGRWISLGIWNARGGLDFFFTLLCNWTTHTLQSSTGDSNPKTMTLWGNVQLEASNFEEKSNEIHHIWGNLLRKYTLVWRVLVKTRKFYMQALWQEYIHIEERIPNKTLLIVGCIKSNSISPYTQGRHSNTATRT